jgi:hypothetical protein
MPPTWVFPPLLLLLLLVLVRVSAPPEPVSSITVTLLPHAMSTADALATMTKRRIFTITSVSRRRRAWQSCSTRSRP